MGCRPGMWMIQWLPFVLACSVLACGVHAPAVQDPQQADPETEENPVVGSESESEAESEAEPYAEVEAPADPAADALAQAVVEAERAISEALEGRTEVSAGALERLSAWAPHGSTLQVFVYEQDRDGLGLGRGCRGIEARVEDDGLHLAARVRRRGRGRCFEEVVLDDQPWNAGQVCEGPGEGSAMGEYQPSSYRLADATGDHAVFQQNVEVMTLHCAPRWQEVACEGGRGLCATTALEAQAVVVAPNQMRAFAASERPFQPDCEAACPPDPCPATLGAVRRAVRPRYVVNSEEPVLGVFRDRAACRAFGRDHR